MPGRARRESETTHLIDAERETTRGVAGNACEAIWKRDGMAIGSTPCPLGLSSFRSFDRTIGPSKLPSAYHVGKRG